MITGGMNKRRRCFCSLSILLLLVISPAAGAQSIFGSYGIGELRYFIHTRSAGMGGAGLAVPDAIAQNHLNPALMAAAGYTSFSGGLQYEGINLSRSSRTYTSQHMQAYNFGFTIKATKTFAFGGGLVPYSDTDFSIIAKTPGYTKKLEGSGGTSMASFGAAYRFNKNISLGINYLLLFGASDETWSIDFTDNYYDDSVSKFDRSRWGSGVSVGMHAAVLPGLHVGGTFFSKITLNTTNRVSYYSGKNSTSAGGAIRLPYSYGAGAAYTVKQRFTVAGDIFFWQFNNLEDAAFQSRQYRNSTRYSIGAELAPEQRASLSLFQKLSYRIGFYYWDLYSRDIDNSPLSEAFVTAGCMLPFLGNTARIDIALEGGMRSSQSQALGSEKIFRLHVSLTGGEIWFIRL